MATAAERRAAQRRLAREIKTGTFKPSQVGAKARRVASERDTLVNKIYELKKERWGNNEKWNAKRARASIRTNPEGMPISNETLKETLARLEKAKRDKQRDNLHVINEILADDDDPDIRNAAYYH